MVALPGPALEHADRGRGGRRLRRGRIHRRALLAVERATRADSAQAADPRTGGERARTVAIIDHLERSERVLLDLSNAEGPDVDVSVEQAWAADLVDANRLYREAATQAGETTTASVLDDLERSLLDIVHAPSTLTPAELEDVRARLRRLRTS